MKLNHGIRIGIVLISAACAFAQDRFEISSMYWYLHFDPTTTGLSSRNFNPGGGAGIALNFLPRLGNLWVIGGFSAEVD